MLYPVIAMNQIRPFFPPASSLAAWGSDPSALIFEGEETNYRDLSQRAQACAAMLTGRGVRPGDPAAVFSPSPFTTSLLIYATLYLGVTIFPLDPCMAEGRRNRLLAQAGCRWVLSDVELDGLPDGMETIRIDFPVTVESVLKPNDNGGEAQLIIATSGSEGEPKGVMLSGGNIAASLAASRSRLGLDPGDLWLNCLPMFHVGGVMIAYRCLDAGAGMLLHSGFDADKVWSDLHDYPVTHISLVPAMLARLLDLSADASPPERLQVVLIGGGHIAPGLAARAHAAGWPLCVSYGMSESCSQCATDCGEGAGLASGLVGLPLEGFEISLSEQGRIMLRGTAVMIGYTNPDRSLGLGLSDTGWFTTGDLGEVDAEGRLRVLGRADDLLISGGKTIHPGEVEDLMIACPGVGEVAISARPDQTWGDLLVALYTGDAPVDEIEAWCRENLPPTLRPRVFMRVEGLPRKGMGKLDRNGLRAMASQG